MLLGDCMTASSLMLVSVSQLTVYLVVSEPPRAVLL